MDTAETHYTTTSYLNFAFASATGREPYEVLSPICLAQLEAI
jgi:hypothetical protein